MVNGELIQPWRGRFVLLGRPGFVAPPRFGPQIYLRFQIQTVRPALQLASYRRWEFATVACEKGSLLGKKGKFLCQPTNTGPFEGASAPVLRVIADEHAVQRDLVDRHGHLRSAAQLYD